MTPAWLDPDFVVDAIAVVFAGAAVIVAALARDQAQRQADIAGEATGHAERAADAAQQLVVEQRAEVDALGSQLPELRTQADAASSSASEATRQTAIMQEALDKTDAQLRLLRESVAQNEPAAEPFIHAVLPEGYLVKLHAVRGSVTSVRVEWDFTPRRASTGMVVVDGDQSPSVPGPPSDSANTSLIRDGQTGWFLLSPQDVGTTLTVHWGRRGTGSRHREARYELVALPGRGKRGLNPVTEAS